MTIVSYYLYPSSAKDFHVPITNSKLELLLEQKSQLEAKIKLEKERELTRGRKNETRRKILVGAYFIEKFTKSDSLEKLFTELDKFLYKPKDRVLFGLDPNKKNENLSPADKETI
jgi:large subunit ribosomal protein L7/L12